MKIEKARTGFCFGVKRALNIIEQAARQRGGIETLGAVVHNEQVLENLARVGVKVCRSIDDIQGSVVATSSHGIGPEVEKALRTRKLDIISTTCPFVRRAQMTARRLADADFTVVVYGDASHLEVKGILEWTRGKGMATLDAELLKTLPMMPRRIGILSQTTQIPELFNQFVKDIIDLALVKDAEIRIVETICHDIRERQSAALDLARRVALMLVVGGRSSANTNRLVDLCSTATTTYLVQTADEIDPRWLEGINHIGITAGASTAEATVQEVIDKLVQLSGDHCPNKPV